VKECITESASILNRNSRIIPKGPLVDRAFGLSIPTIGTECGTTMTLLRHLRDAHDLRGRRADALRRIDGAGPSVGVILVKSLWRLPGEVGGSNRSRALRDLHLAVIPVTHKQVESAAMADVYVRRLVRADLGAVTDFIRLLGYPATRDAVAPVLDRFMSEEGHFGAVAISAEEIVGLITVCPRPSLSLQGTLGTIAELVVRPDRRRRGIATRLLLYVEGLAAAHGYVRLEAPVPAGASGAGSFFLNAGFEIAAERAYRWAPLESKHPRLPMPGLPRAASDVTPG